MLLIILLAKGWTVVRRKISAQDRVKIAGSVRAERASARGARARRVSPLLPGALTSRTQVRDAVLLGEPDAAGVPQARVQQRALHVHVRERAGRAHRAPAARASHGSGTRSTRRTQLPRKRGFYNKFGLLFSASSSRCRCSSPSRATCPRRAASSSSRRGTWACCSSRSRLPPCWPTRTRTGTRASRSGAQTPQDLGIVAEIARATGSRRRWSCALGERRERRLGMAPVTMDGTRSQIYNASGV